MPIEGPIRELGVSDLLQLLALSRRTGDLTATHATSSETLRVHFEDGAISGVGGVPQDLRFGRLAVLREGVSEEEVARVLTLARRAPGRRIGESLLERAALDEPAVRRVLEFQISETIFDLLRWSDGQLVFEERSPEPRHPHGVRLSTDSVLLDVVRRLDEMAEITGVDPQLDVRPTLAEHGRNGDGALTLRTLDWEVLAEVDGVRTLRGIARQLGRGQLETAVALRSLRTSGIVEMRIVPEDAAPVRASTDSALDPTFNAVGESIDGGDLSGARRSIDGMLQSDPGSSEAHRSKEIIETSSGEIELGIRHLDRAAEIDPARGATYLHLAAALIERGELNRARGALDTLLALASPNDPSRERARVLLRQTLSALEEE